jgi:hypothetical protein
MIQRIRRGIPVSRNMLPSWPNMIGILVLTPNAKVSGRRRECKPERGGRVRIAVLHGAEKRGGASLH